MKLFGIEWGAQRSKATSPSADDVSAAGRALAELACLAPREKVKARARLMREQMGLPPHPALEPRDGFAVGRTGAH